MRRSFVGLALLGLAGACDPVVAQSPASLQAESRGSQPPTDIPTTAKVGYRRMWVIAIGTSYYQAGDRLPTLPNPEKDARAFEDLLCQEFGFRRPGFDLLGQPRDKVIAALERLAAAEPGDVDIRPDDLVVVFIAGHGIDRGGRFFLPCSDSRVGVGDDLTKTCIAGETLIEAVMKAPARHKLLIVDACHSGILLGGKQDAAQPTPPGPAANSLRRWQEGDAGFVFVSGEYGTVGDGPEDGQSPFAAILLQGLLERADTHRPDHVFTIDELAARVGARVKEQTKDAQVPVLHRKKAGSGRVLFRPVVHRATPREIQRAKAIREAIDHGIELGAEGLFTAALSRFDKARQRSDGTEPTAGTHRPRLGTTLRLCPPVKHVWFHDDGPVTLGLHHPLRPLVATFSDARITFWNTQSGEELRRVSLASPAASAEFDPGGTVLRSVHGDGAVLTWSVDRLGQFEQTLAPAEPGPVLLKHGPNPAEARWLVARPTRAAGGGRVNVGGESFGTIIDVFAAARPDPITRVPIDDGVVSGVSLSDDGLTVAAILAHDPDVVFHHKHPQREAVQRVVTLPDAAMAVAMRPDGASAAVCCRDSRRGGEAARIIFFDPRTGGQFDGEILLFAPVEAMAFSDQNQFVVLSEDGFVTFEFVGASWRERLGGEVIWPAVERLWQGFDRTQRYAVVTTGGVAKLIDRAGDGLPAWTIHPPRGVGQLLYAADGDRLHLLLDPSSDPRQRLCFFGGDSAVFSLFPSSGLDVNPDTGATDALADVATPMVRWIGSDGASHAHLVVPDDGDATLALHRPGRPAAALPIRAEDREVIAVQISSGTDGVVLTETLRDKRYRLVVWTAEIAARIAARDDVLPAGRQSWNPRYRRALVNSLADGGPQLRVWDIDRDELLAWGWKDMSTGAFSPDGRLLAVNDGETVQLFDMERGAALQIGSGVQSVQASTFAFSPDSRWLATGGGRDRSVTVWNVANGRSQSDGADPRPPVVVSVADRVTAIRFDPTSRRIAVVTEGNAVAVHDAETGVPLSPLLQHPAAIRDVAFRPLAGRQLATVAADNVVRLWTVATDAAGGENWRLITTALDIGDVQAVDGIQAGAASAGLPSDQWRAWQQAGRDLPRVREADPGQAVEWHRLAAEQAVAMQLWDLARIQYSELAKLQPTRSEWPELQAAVCAKMGQWAEAREAAKRAVRVDPRSPMAWQRLAESYYNAAEALGGADPPPQDVADAIAASLEADRLSPDNPWILHTLGFFQLLGGDREAAAATLERACRLDEAASRLDPRQRRSLLKLTGRCLATCERWQEAAAIYEQATAVTAGDVNHELAWIRTRLEQATGDPGGQSRQFRQLVDGETLVEVEAVMVKLAARDEKGFAEARMAFLQRQRFAPSRVTQARLAWLASIGPDCDSRGCVLARELAYEWVLTHGMPQSDDDAVGEDLSADERREYLFGLLIATVRRQQKGGVDRRDEQPRRDEQLRLIFAGDETGLFADCPADQRAILCFLGAIYHATLGDARTARERFDRGDEHLERSQAGDWRSRFEAQLLKAEAEKLLATP